MDVRDRSTYTSSPESVGLEATTRLRTDGQSTPSTGSTAPAKDSSDLSPAAQVVAQALQLPEVRQDRVASLQQQIASGTYQVPPQEVADAILRNLHG
jgi:flagellar biosynthesis anti-sigma factor FlgM